MKYKSLDNRFLYQTAAVLFWTYVDGGSKNNERYPDEPRKQLLDRYHDGENTETLEKALRWAEGIGPKKRQLIAMGYDSEDLNKVEA